VRRALTAWERFWFDPQATSSLALVRIALGLIVTGWTLALLPDLSVMYTSDGVLPKHPTGQGAGVWGLLQILHGDTAVVVLYVLLLVSAIALTLGFFTRLAALVAFLGVLSFERRNPWAFNSGDGLVRVLLLFVAVAPAGASLSLDRLRRARAEFWSFPPRSVWGVRLIQILVSVIYLSTVWQKLRGTTWNDGTAVSYAFRLEDLQRFPVPSLVPESSLLSNLMTWGTLVVEFSIGVFVWNRTLRPWVLGAGVLMHLGIDYTLRVGFFSYAMFAAYLSFVPPETASAWILRARDALARIRRKRRRARAVAGPATASPD